jgi:riboflavin synthase
MTIELPSAELEYYVIPKGSVAVDGVSLTVARLQDGGSFEVMVIPHTLRMTTLGEKREGARVNLEMDLIGKYVHRLLSNAGRPEPIEGRAGLIPR